MFKKRLLAFIIDFTIIFFLNAILRFIFVFPLMRKENPLVDLIDSRTTILMVLSLVFLVFRDTFNSRSFGKKILCLNIIDLETSKVASISKRILRNITLVIAPIEILLLILEKPLVGDLISNTTVTDDFVD